MIRILALCGLVTLAGCATTPPAPPSEQIAPPRADLLVPPKQLPALPAKADMYADNAQCSAAYVKESGKLKSLQTYVKTILKKD